MKTPETPEELLAQMVSFDTVNQLFGGRPGGEAALGAHLEAVAQGWGLRTRRCGLAGDGVSFNLLVSWEPVPGGEWLLFESHLDTVGVEGMTIEPFAGKISGGKIHGRGTCDTKGSGAAALWALREYARGSPAPRNVGLFFVFDEEARMTGAQAVAKGELPGYLPRLRGVVIGEPTLMRPIVAHNGVIRWRTITRGVAAHSADPSRGRSAIAAMIKVMEALEARFVPLATRAHPLTGRAAASINVIRGGTAVNIIPARCEIEIDRRTAPGESADQILAERDAALAGLEVEHDSLYVVPAFGEELGRAFHAWLAPVLARNGVDPSPCGAPYVTDASHYAAAGAPTVVLGPGNFAQAHTKDEWLALDQLALAVKVYGELMTAPVSSVPGGLPVRTMSGGGSLRPDLKTNPDVLRDFLDRRFGIFIHWGPVTLTGREIGWSRGRDMPVEEYDQLYLRFNPVKFNAREWVALVKASGARYLVMVTKHHDGFCLWDTRETDYNIMHTPFGRDVLRELADECKSQGVLFGTYYSVIDSLAFGWSRVPHPPEPEPNPPIRGGIEPYVNYLEAQCGELIERYGTAILWFDMSSAIDLWTPRIGADVYAHLHAKNERLLMNSRLDNGNRGPERAVHRPLAERVGDFETREQEIGSYTETPWENCAPITDNWEWRPNDRAKDLRASMSLLLQCIGGNGNFLYNISPGPDGSVEPDQARVLRGMGEWLGRHGESVYGTRGGPYMPADGFVSTRSGSRVFLHLFKGQAGIRVAELPGLKVVATRLLGGGKPGLVISANAYEFAIPADLVSPLDTVIEITFDGDVMSLPVHS